MTKMVSLKELKCVAMELLCYAEKQPEVKEAEAYVSCNRLNVYRIAYHSKIPSNGLEEPKSEEDYGLSLRLLFKGGKYGMGSSDSSIAMQGFKEAYDKALRSKVHDNDFHSLPEPMGKAKAGNGDAKIINTDEGKGVKKAYAFLDGAFSALRKTKFLQDINITGELDMMASRFAVENSKGVSASDESAMSFATVTTSLEAAENSTGTSFESSVTLSRLDARECGKDSAEKALSMQKPSSLDSGKYRVVLSESVVAELFYSRFDVALSSIDYNASPFIGKMGQEVAVKELNVSDEPNLKGMIGSRAVTDEGIPTKKTELVKNGMLVNYLSNDYYTKKKPEWARFRPLNGFRSGLERSYGGDVGIHGTNITVANGSHSKEELLQEVKNGIYVGRLWYTYPVNGHASPDFTATVRGDSYIIENGRIAGALTPNTMRVLDSFYNFMKGIIGIGKKQKAVLAWGQEETIVTPEIAVAEMSLKKISKGIY